MNYFFLLLILLSTSTSFSQQTPEDENSIENQFDAIYRTSTNYQTYKVISKESYERLKLNVLDSINFAKKIILEKENLLIRERNLNKTNQELLSKAQLDLENATKKENSIAFFGMQLSKTKYNILLWGILLLLIASVSYYFFKFIKSNVLTKEAQENLFLVEKDFEKHKKQALEREQKLRRKLQDEINKQRNA